MPTPFVFVISADRNYLQIFMATTKTMLSTVKEGTRKFPNIFVSGLHAVCFALKHTLLLRDYYCRFYEF